MQKMTTEQFMLYVQKYMIGVGGVISLGLRIENALATSISVTLGIN